MRGQATNQIDWVIILVYILLVLSGWINIYAADYDLDTSFSIFNFSQSSGKQLVWMVSSIVIGLVIFTIDYRFYESFAYIFYGILLLLLVSVLFFGREVAGSTSWFEIGSFKLQPSEFAKIATSLAIARYFNSPTRKVTESKYLLIASALFLVPIGLIILQGDTGTALVYTSFILVLFREGLSPSILMIGIGGIVIFVLTLVVNQTILIIGVVIVTLILIGLYGKSVRKGLLIGVMSLATIGVVISVDFVLNDVLKPHQQKRVMSLINPNADPLGVGWNVTQSKIAIGSGGFSGKGFLNGTQTKFDFVPEQTTDFIFCTIGEEHGWLGSSIVLVLFAILLVRITMIAERQKSDFVRVYGYCVFSIIFFHFTINIAMTIGLFPVVGIPLPFFSYGGSSLWTFSVLLFILLKLDSHRMELLQRL